MSHVEEQKLARERKTLKRQQAEKLRYEQSLEKVFIPHPCPDCLNDGLGHYWLPSGEPLKPSLDGRKIYKMIGHSQEGFLVSLEP